jgi:hypothetical protein
MYTDRKLFLVIALLLALWMSGVAGYMLIEHRGLRGSPPSKPNGAAIHGGVDSPGCGAFFLSARCTR